MTARAVLLGTSDVQTSDVQLDALAVEAEGVAGDAAAALALADRLASSAPVPGEGETIRLWRLLATLGAADLTAARVAEAHLDALAILRQAGSSAEPGRTWGVFAAEAPVMRLEATPAGEAGADDGWVLSGTKPWCSLAGRLDSALVTAHTPGERRRLFEVGLRAPGVDVQRGSWHSRGLADVESGPVRFDRVAARPVGDDGWYLSRPGFAWGGMGVAACWFGGAVGLGRALLRAAERREPDQLALLHLGAVDTALSTARAVLESAAADVDSGRAEGQSGSRLALRVRRVVATAAEQVLATVGHALGPAPLTFDDDHARRVADLTVYLRQEHAERDAAALGRSTLAAHLDGNAEW